MQNSQRGIVANARLMQAGRTIAFVAGEASGDLLAAPVISEALNRAAGNALCRHRWRPHDRRRIRCLAPCARTVGTRVRRGAASFAALLRLRRALRERVIAEKPQVFVGVDAPDFNLALEEQLRAKGVRTVHFVSPSIWAWRGERTSRSGARSNACCSSFRSSRRSMTTPQYRRSMSAHPLASMIPMVPNAAAARQRLGLRGEGPCVEVLPSCAQPKSVASGRSPRFAATAQLAARAAFNPFCVARGRLKLARRQRADDRGATGPFRAREHF